MIENVHSGIPLDLRFEQYELHKDLVIVRTSGTHNVIGYLNRHPEESAWFWFILSEYSDFYSSKDEALEALIHSFITAKMNNNAKKIGIYGNDKYVKT